MTNRPKNIGTAGETAVVRYLVPNGFPHAERRALAGSSDLGDITGCPSVCWEVKAGKAAELSTDGDLAAWQAQTLAEQANSRADVAVLVCKRKAVGSTRVGHWWAWMPLGQAAALGCSCPCSEGCVGSQSREAGAELPNPWVRMTLADAVALLRHGGYGTPLDHVTESRDAA